MLEIRPDGKKKITLTDLLICGVLGAAWWPLGITAALGIGASVYWQTKIVKWIEEQKTNPREEVKKLKD